MNINRHNYEEFFLMYVDNELPAAERAAVDRFIQENPDLAPELELLAQTSLPAEPFSFAGKNDLIKPEPIPSEARDQMLLMLDAELGTDESRELHKEIRHNPAMQSEWNILQQTKLDPADSIEFPHKASLYHHTAGRVVSIRFLRMAAAAAIIGFGIYLGISALEKKGKTETEMANHDADQHNKSVNIGQQQEQDAVKDQADRDQLADRGITPSAEQQDAKDPNTQRQDSRDLPGRPVQHDGRNLAALPGKPAAKDLSSPDNVTARPDRKNISNNNSQFASNRGSEKKSVQESNFSDPSGVQSINKALSPERTQPTLIAGVNPEEKRTEIKPLSALDTDIMQPLTVPDARTAALNPDEEGDKNDILFLDESRVKKTKLSGMFRKLKRTIERKANIKTGNGVKIAGFEIAVR